MKRSTGVASVAAACVVLSAALVWAAGTGETVSYVGRLENNGVPVQGSVTLVARLYADAAAVNALGPPETLTTQVSQGVFSVDLTLPEAAITSNTLFVTFEVNGTPLSGTQRVRPVPYAIRSNRSDTASQATNADALRGVTQMCILRVGSTASVCPAPFNVTTGRPEFAHSHALPVHSHEFRVDGSLINSGATGCTLDLPGGGSGQNINCSDFGGGTTVRTRQEGVSNTSTGTNSFMVCCNY